MLLFLSLSLHICVHSNCRITCNWYWASCNIYYLFFLLSSGPSYWNRHRLLPSHDSSLNPCRHGLSCLHILYIGGNWVISQKCCRLSKGVRNVSLDKIIFLCTHDSSLIYYNSISRETFFPMETLTSLQDKNRAGFCY